MKKPITRQMHGAADYAYAPLMFAAPKIAGFEDEKQAVTVCQIVGGGVLASTHCLQGQNGECVALFHLRLI